MDFQKLKQEKEKIKLQELRLKAKKMRITQREKAVQKGLKYDLGDLILKAGIEKLSRSALLGAFLEIQEKGKEESVLKQWEEKGTEAFEREKAEHGEPLIVSLKKELPKEMEDKLRKLGLRWNRFRKEWQGHGKKEELAKILAPFSPTVEAVE